VKLIQIEPHKRLSLQLHHHRSEHWIVVEGKAKVTNSKGTWQVKTNESTFIPKNCIHRLENPTDKPLKIIEVQNGNYLGEDDIERLENDYGRDNINDAKRTTQYAIHTG
jgi:mannose-1-phosphate guanylyltransferase/mannose-6-phosphate isomerase